MGDLGTDLDDLAGGLVADDMRLGDQRSAEAVEGIAAFDADRLDPDQHALRRAGRIRDVLIAQHARIAVLVIDRGLHDLRPPTTCLAAIAGARRKVFRCFWLFTAPASGSPPVRYMFR